MTNVRDRLKLIYKAGMILATATLAILAYIAYRNSTAGTGDVLMSIVLGVLAVFALLSIQKLDLRDDQTETYRGILDDVRRHFPVTIQFKNAGDPPSAAAAAGAPISVQFAEPEIHRVDASAVDEAKRMASEGAPIDDICRMIDPDHDGHDPFHQEAFRRLVQAMINEA